MEVGKDCDKAKGGPVFSIWMKAQRGRESLESRCLETSRQWRFIRLSSTIGGPPTLSVGIAPHTEIEMNSKVGFAFKKSKKGGNRSPGMSRLRDERDVKRRSFVSKERLSKESDRMVDKSPNRSGRLGKSANAGPVTSMITSVITGEGIESLENVSDNPSGPDSLKRSVFMRLRWSGP